MLAGGYSRPLLGTCSPVALATAVRFDRRLGAVEEAVEHLRIEAAALRLLGRQAVVAPHRVGRRLAEVRQPLVAAAGRDDREAAGARPVDQVADQRRLVAEGERIQHAGRRRTLRQQRTAEGIGLDRDVDHVLAVVEGAQAVLDRRDRMAGAFDDDVDLRMARPAPASRRRCGSCRCGPRRPGSTRRCARSPSRRARGWSRALAGDRSAMPTSCTPGVRGICARYIEPNLPAPIRPMRIGRFSAARC